jgi:AcrR family transcriptional regulator
MGVKHLTEPNHGAGAMNQDKNSLTRTAILDATEQIMREEGYAAVSSRKIASKAGLKSQLVHYYFRSMDELFMALFQRVEEQQFQRLTQAIASKEPLRTLWKINIDTNGPWLNKEFIALATHREQLRQEIARAAERTRRIYAAVLARVLEERGIGQTAWPPVVLSILLDGASRLINSETALGTSAGHAETIAFIEHYLEQIEGLAAASPIAPYQSAAVTAEN